MELSDGSALLLTYGRLIPPGGASFHGAGLDPDISVEAGSGEDAAWYRAVQALMAKRP